MTQFRPRSEFTFGQETAAEAKAKADEKQAADKQEADEKKIADAKAKKADEAKADAKRDADAAVKAAEKKVADAKEAKKSAAKAKSEEKEPRPVHRPRLSVLRDLVESIEDDPDDISDEARTAFRELNRRLTRALAK